MKKIYFYILNKKTSLLIMLLFCGQIIISCHKRNCQKNRLKVSVELISYRDNTIQVFYKTKADDRYFEKYSLVKKIKGSKSSQNLIFELPIGIKPKNIRLDLGENENENDSIHLVNVSFQYKNRVVDGNNGVYKSWFIFNPNVIEGKDSLTYHLKRKNSVFDPQLNGNKKLNAKLVKLFPPDINEKE
jgi:hypothetical protein